MLGTPLLFLGPGKDSAGDSEVFSLPVQGGGLSTAFSTVPDFPVPDIRGYVAIVKDGYLQICGNISVGGCSDNDACPIHHRRQVR